MGAFATVFIYLWQEVAHLHETEGEATMEQSGHKLRTKGEKSWLSSGLKPQEKLSFRTPMSFALSFETSALGKDGVFGMVERYLCFSVSLYKGRGFRITGRRFQLLHSCCYMEPVSSEYVIWTILKRSVVTNEFEKPPTSLVRNMSYLLIFFTEECNWARTALDFLEKF